ncbi:hypothetical protein B0T21DRAFT_378075 [Apiosordaria backusii]|uniref:Uncharacterized protein n=1 Tax=Apiosordaria backusii TaxID=314023 RepID=A0AA40DK03_9PEZI|nr:hypothetical protein B0T21DRAFT_378075 [Apiosordaria backusii]
MILHQVITCPNRPLWSRKSIKLITTTKRAKKRGVIRIRPTTLKTSSKKIPANQIFWKLEKLFGQPETTDFTRRTAFANRGAARGR